MKKKISIAFLLANILFIIFFKDYFHFFIALYAAYLAFLDFKSKEVEYPDVVSLFLIGGYFSFIAHPFIFIIFIIVSIVWSILEFIIFAKNENLIMKIGIVDMFYCTAFFIIFFKNLVLRFDALSFSFLVLGAITLSFIFFIVYKKMYKTNMVPYLFILSPLFILNSFLF